MNIPMLEGRPTCDLVAKLPQCWSLAVHKFCAASEECCEQGYGSVCIKKLLLDVVAHESNQNYCSYVHELSRFTFGSQHQSGGMGSCMKDLIKEPQNCQSWRVDAFL